MGCHSLNKLGVAYAHAKSNPAFTATLGVFRPPIPGIQYFRLRSEVYHVYKLTSNRRVVAWELGSTTASSRRATGMGTSPVRPWPAASIS